MSLEDLTPEARDELAMLAKQLADNPQTRKDMLRLTKRVRPDLPIPELEIEERTSMALAQAEHRVQSLEAKLQEKEALNELERRRKTLLEKGLVDDKSQIEEVEKVMLEKGITNHEAAAEYWKWMRQSAEPTPVGYNPSPLSNVVGMKQFFKNPQQAARDAAHQALSELRKNPRPIGL
jgi:hypothetical protein